MAGFYLMPCFPQGSDIQLLGAEEFRGGREMLLTGADLSPPRKVLQERDMCASIEGREFQPSVQIGARFIGSLREEADDVLQNGDVA